MCLVILPLIRGDIIQDIKIYPQIRRFLLWKTPNILNGNIKLYDCINFAIAISLQNRYRRQCQPMRIPMLFPLQAQTVTIRHCETA